MIPLILGLGLLLFLILTYKIGAARTGVANQETIWHYPDPDKWPVLPPHYVPMGSARLGNPPEPPSPVDLWGAGFDPGYLPDGPFTPGPITDPGPDEEPGPPPPPVFDPEPVLDVPPETGTPEWGSGTPES